MQKRLTLLCEELALIIFCLPERYPTLKDYDLLEFSNQNVLEKYDDKKIKSYLKKLQIENYSESTISKWFVNPSSTKTQSKRWPKDDELKRISELYNLEESQFKLLVIKSAFENYLITKVLFEKEISLYKFYNIINNDQTEAEKLRFNQILNTWKNRFIFEYGDKNNEEIFDSTFLNNYDFLYSIWDKGDIKEIKKLKKKLQKIVKDVSEKIHELFKIELEFENLSWQYWRLKIQIDNFKSKIKVFKKKSKILNKDPNCSIDLFKQKLEEYQESSRAINSDEDSQNKIHYGNMNENVTAKTVEASPFYEEETKKMFKEFVWLAGPLSLIKDNIPRHVKKKLNDLFMDACDIRNNHRKSTVLNFVQQTELVVFLEKAREIYSKYNLPEPKMVVKMNENISIKRQIQDYSKKIEFLKEKYDDYVIKITAFSAHKFKRLDDLQEAKEECKNESIKLERQKQKWIDLITKHNREDLIGL